MLTVDSDDLRAADWIDECGWPDADNREPEPDELDLMLEHAHARERRLGDFVDYVRIDDHWYPRYSRISARRRMHDEWLALLSLFAGQPLTTLTSTSLDLDVDDDPRVLSLEPLATTPVAQHAPPHRSRPAFTAGSRAA